MAPARSGSCARSTRRGRLLVFRRDHRRLLPAHLPLAKGEARTYPFSRDARGGAQNGLPSLPPMPARGAGPSRAPPGPGGGGLRRGVGHRPGADPEYPGAGGRDQRVPFSPAVQAGDGRHPWSLFQRRSQQAVYVSVVGGGRRRYGGIWLGSRSPHVMKWPPPFGGGQHPASRTGTGDTRGMNDAGDERPRRTVQKR